MLETLLKTATLSAKDREVFEGMYDAAFRYGGLSKKQVAWIESIYYKLPKISEKVQGPKTGNFKSSCVTQQRTVRSVDQFKALCTDASEDALKKVRKFFREGGEVIKVSPKG